MASEVKYKKGGGNSSAVNSSYNRRKLNVYRKREIYYAYFKQE
jgi:hypothetical protein